MKKLYFLLIALSLFSCQNEENTVNQDNDAALTRTSPLAALVMRVSQNPTHWDNILDGDDCYSVQLPVEITLNGQNLLVQDESDFDAVQQNMDASSSDDDIVHFHFPIVITFRDFYQHTITSQAQLDAVTCESEDEFNEIRCVDFIFPITINTYNTDNQIANTVTIDNNQELYNFICYLNPGAIFTIVYPVTVTFGSGPAVTIQSNGQLENAIQDVIADCDDSGPGPQPISLQDIIMSGSWHISYCEDDDWGSGQPIPYNGYNFTFNPNGTVTAVKNGIPSNGTWDLYTDGSHQMIDLYFPSLELFGLTNDEWRIIEYNQTTFRLKNDQSSWDGHDYVYFTKN